MTAGCTAIATSGRSATIPRARPPVGAQETTAALVHLRRPSKLSTLQLPDTQPFDDPAGRFAFSHNGDLRDTRAARATYRAQGRIHGRADTEVGARWLEDAWRDDQPAAHLLAALHDRFGGQANLAVLAADGAAHHYAGNDENPVFTFRLGSIGHRLDRHLLAGPVRVPVRRAGRYRASPGATPRDGRAGPSREGFRARRRMTHRRCAGPPREPTRTR